MLNKYNHYCPQYSKDFEVEKKLISSKNSKKVS